MTTPRVAPGCEDTAVIEHGGGQPHEFAPGTTDPGPDPTFYATPAAVHGWRCGHLPFTNLGDASNFRTRLRQLLDAFYMPGNRQLGATYTTADTTPVDVENVLLYNVMAAREFSRLSEAGITLERVVGAPVPPPGGGASSHHHAYEAAPPEGTWQATTTVRPVAEFTSHPLTALTASTKVAEVWWAVKCGELRTHEAWNDGLVLRLWTEGPSAVVPSQVVKPIIDGVVAALHHAIGVDTRAVERIAVHLGQPPERIRGAVISAEHAPLGARRLVWPWGDAVQWNPADDRVVAIELRHDMGASFRIRGEVFAAKRRPSPYERIRGCLLGGAVGDALGEPVEFLSLSEVRARHGTRGVTGPDDFGGKLRISDDTQMTLFTAEGILRFENRATDRHAVLPPLVWMSYLRWLATQGGPAHDTMVMSGELVKEPLLWARRAPGNTCLSALRGTTPGSIENPLNSSKGCGGVMRVAPVAFSLDIEDAFQAGAELAALTHGHPSGYLAAGSLAQLIRSIHRGVDIREAAGETLDVLASYRGHEEVHRAVVAALELADRGDPTAELVESLGAGWVAEEALAIGLYCAVSTTTFAEGVRLAVNHGGDSDSTGSIAGQLLGVLHGAGAGPQRVPQDWIEALDAAEVVERVAADVARHSVLGFRDDKDRYPDG